jgi:hypothetical protein
MMYLDGRTNGWRMEVDELKVGEKVTVATADFLLGDAEFLRAHEPGVVEATGFACGKPVARVRFGPHVLTLRGFDRFLVNRVEDTLIPGVDYEPAVCDNCGRDKHTERQLKACIRSATAPVTPRWGPS